MNPITSLLNDAFTRRENLFDAEHLSAFRLFNGFNEGLPDLSVDAYAQTLVFQNYANTEPEYLTAAEDFLLEKFRFIDCIILKSHKGSQDDKLGKIIHGTKPADRIKENGLWYALDLMMNQDASFYLDTRNLRQWMFENLKSNTVLNTFAYTGSLGVAALAGGAKRVVQTDINKKFLNLAKSSYTLNGIPINRNDFFSGDFFQLASKFKRENEFFDCVVLDPPFFSATPKGKVDLTESARLINKVRPLINDGGYLIAVNNALFVSGADYMNTLNMLCADGYLKIETLIPVPEDFIGLANPNPVSNPAPFNHSTKIAVLKIKRK